MRGSVFSLGVFVLLSIHGKKGPGKGFKMRIGKIGALCAGILTAFVLTLAATNLLSLAIGIITMPISGGKP